MHENPLNRYADLSGMIEPPLAQEGEGLVEFGVSGHDDRGCSPVLQRAAGSRSQFGAQHPTHPGTAYEGEEAHSWIHHQGLGQFSLLGDQYLTPALGEPGLLENSDKPEGGEWRIFGRLDDDRATDGNGWSGLVDDQIQRVIKSTDRHHHADRLPPGEGNPPLRRRGQIHGDLLAPFGAQEFDTTPDSIDGPGYLHPRVG